MRRAGSGSGWGMYEPLRRDGECCPVRQLVVSLPEQVDVSNAGPVREQLLRYAGGGVGVLIADLTAAISCDHAGAAALARVYERAVANGTELRLVISAPAIRRMIAISGLDRLVPVFPTVAAAQAERLPAEVVRLPSREAGTRAAAAAALPDGPRPVSWLPEAHPAAAARPGSSLGQAAPGGRLAETLTQLTGAIFQAALTLQTAIGLPARALAQAVEDALYLLDSTVREARTAAFTLAGTGADSPADPSTRGAVAPPGRHAGAATPLALAKDARRLARRLTHEARQTRAQSMQHRTRSKQAQTRSQQTRAQALQIARLAASTRLGVAAATLISITGSQPAVPVCRPGSQRPRAGGHPDNISGDDWMRPAG